MINSAKVLKACHVQITVLPQVTCSSFKNSFSHIHSPRTYVTYFWYDCAVLSKCFFYWSFGLCGYMYKDFSPFWSLCQLIYCMNSLCLILFSHYWLWESSLLHVQLYFKKLVERGLCCGAAGKAWINPSLLHYQSKAFFHWFVNVPYIFWKKSPLLCSSQKHSHLLWFVFWFSSWYN